MEKEILTPEYVRKLVKKESMGFVIALPFFAVLVTVFLLSLIIGCFAIGENVRGTILSIATAGVLFIVIRVFIRHFDRLRKLPKEPQVVIGKRILPPKNRPETYVSNKREGYYLYFEHYGAYSIIGDAYPDGLCDGLEAGGLFYSSLYGDEFYLVLDQDCKIVLAYQCNCFEYTGEITQHVIVNGRIGKD